MQARKICWPGGATLRRAIVQSQKIQQLGQSLIPAPLVADSQISLTIRFNGVSPLTSLKLTRWQGRKRVRERILKVRGSMSANRGGEGSDAGTADRRRQRHGAEHR